MLKDFFIIWLLLISYLSSSILRIKPLQRKSRNFGFQGLLKDSKVKVSPTMDEYSDFTNHIITENIQNCQNQNQYKFLSLPDVLIEEIFEYLLLDYSNVKLVCKDFACIFDQMAYRMVWYNFPNGTPKTFSKYPKYKMIRLAPIFITVKKHFKPSKKYLSVLETVFEVLYYLRKNYRQKALIAISIFLKLKYIPWAHFISFDPFEIHQAWTIGLLTIARFLVQFDLNRFLNSIDYESRGIVTAIGNDQKSLAMYMIHVIRSTKSSIISAFPRYFDKIIRKCIEMKNWDVLQLLYSDYPEADYRNYLRELAKLGFVEGLRVLREPARKHPKLLAHVAVANGNLNILKELNDLDILVEASNANQFGETAIHVAVSHDKFDCFVYLDDALKKKGKDYLNVADNEGNLPIHLAVHFSNSKTLIEIIRRNPRYKYKNPFKETLSPLHIAVACAHKESANILLNVFPELIKYQDSDGNTVIHVSIGNASEEMLELLLTCAPVDIIKSRNINGNTALHVAAKNGQIKMVSILLATKRFTGLERNCEGMTPIGLLARKHPKMPVSQFLSLFKVSLEVFSEAIEWKRLSCCDVLSILFNKS